MLNESSAFFYEIYLRRTILLLFYYKITQIIIIT